MVRWVWVGLFAIPVFDIIFLVYVASVIGGVPTIALVVLTALIGLLLVRAEGRHTLRNIQRKFAVGEIPTNDVIDGGLLIAAGAFLLTPGLVTDAIGLLIVIPPSRTIIRTLVKRWFIVPVLDSESGGFVTGNVYTYGFPDTDLQDDPLGYGSSWYDVDIDVEDPDDEPGKRNP